MSNILLDSTQITGHIYLITNTTSDKKYVGQAVSHRKNKGKYRPFGYEGRFKDHISEAVCNTKKKQCTYLNNAIRLYGKDAFTVELIIECSKDKLDELESFYIKEYNTIYPNGYNLTSGGKIFKTLTTSDIPITTTLNTPKRRGGCKERSSETRIKMSTSLKEIFNTPEMRQEQMIRSQNQHYSKKLENFKGVEIDIDNLDQYIKVRNSKNMGKFIKVCIGDKTTSFVGKYESIDNLRLKAIEFIKSVNSATLPNCSGNP